MDHLTAAIQKLAQDYNFDRTLSASCALLQKYLATGDEKLVPRLLKLGEGEFNVLRQVGDTLTWPPTNMVLVSEKPVI